MDELRYLRAFVTLAEELHFRRAAERLGIAQPPLSNQIRRLEELSGTKLFVRRPAVALTSAGEAFLAHARRALGAVDRGLAEARRAAAGEAGRLVLGFAASTLVSLVPRLARRYVEDRPDVELVLREIPSADQFEALERGEIDVGVLREPPDDRDIESTPILTEPFVAVLPRRHDLSGRKSISLHRLAGDPFVHFPRRVAPGLYDKVSQLCAIAGFTPKVRLEALEWLTIVGLVEAGVGVSLVPASFARLRWGGVRYVGLRPPTLETVTAVCILRARHSPLAERFLALARN